MRALYFPLLGVLVCLGVGCVPDVAHQQTDCPFLTCVPIVLSNDQPADVVIGQPNFSQVTAPASPTQSTLNINEGSPFFDGTSLYVGDGNSNRVLGFAGLPTTNGANASFVIGQANSFTTSTSGVSATNFFSPTTIYEAGGKLVVADFSNIRVLIYNTLPANSAAADVAVGQPNLTTTGASCTRSGLNAPRSLIVAAGKLIVADGNGNRVMIWNQVPTSSGVNADLVLGQTIFTSCAVNQGGTASAGTMNTPSSVWSDGIRLAVADWLNSRVLIWNTFPTSNGQLADIVLGQGTGSSAFTSTTGTTGQAGLNLPDAVDSNGIQLAVADDNNNRVLIWNTYPTQVGALPDVVLGQPDFVQNLANQGSATGGPNTMKSPFGLRFAGGNVLLISDSFNSRLLIFHGH